MNLFALPARSLFLLLFAVCVVLLGFGLYLQHYVGLDPCPMCIMQRFAFVGVGAIALIAGLHAPKRTGQRFYLGLIMLAAVAGAGVAARQSWIQRYPPEFAECGPDLGFMLGSFSLSEALPMIFRGTGQCESIDWTFLGLTLANWSLVCFAGVVAFAVFLFIRRETTFR